MRHLGIDYGTKYVGLALSDESGSIAMPLHVLVNDDFLIQHVASAVDEHAVEAVVVGESQTLSGEDNPVMEDITGFIDVLEDQLEMPVHRQQEAFSSAEAARFAPTGAGHHDAAAAAIILQRFLDTPRVG